jgi:hypothetical protein
LGEGGSQSRERIKEVDIVPERKKGAGGHRKGDRKIT